MQWNSEMTGEQKLQYIWDYYKIHITAVVAAVCICIYLFVLMSRPRQEYALRIAGILETAGVEISEESDFYKGFLAYADEQLGVNWREDKVITMDTSYHFDLSQEADFRGESFRLLTTRLESAEVDGILCSYDNMMGIARGGRILDLSDERAGDILERYEDRLVYYETSDGREIPVAVDLTGSKNIEVLLEDAEQSESVLNDTDTQYYFALASNVTNTDAALVFLEYLLDF